MNIAPEINPAAVVSLRLELEGEDPGFRALSARGESGLSRQFLVRLVVEHPDPDLVPADIIGRRAGLTVANEPRPIRFLGMIRLCKQLNRNAERTSTYELHLVPHTDWLALRRDHRIFKQRKVTQIVKDICGPLKARLQSVRTHGEDELPEHEYRVQYGETDLETVERLLAEDGVTHLYDFRAESELVLVANLVAYLPEEPYVLPFAPPGSMSPEAPHVWAFDMQAVESTSSVELRDHWIERPDYPARAAGDVQEDQDLQEYVFQAGAASTEALLQRGASTRLLSKWSGRRTSIVQSTVFVPPGHRLKIEGGPRKECDEEQLVLSVASSWTDGIASGGGERVHTLVCVPAAAYSWMPPRKPKRRIHGLQKATVTGDGEIDPDELGRVICQFVWDRNSALSRRVLVSQGWAGAGYGMFNQPRIGDEVLVAYLDGDPDEPIVVGRVHNAKNVHPLTLPADKTVSLWRTQSSPGGDGYNEIRMDDKAGEELFSIHAQRDFKGVVLRDQSWNVGRHLSVVVAGDDKTNITGRSDTRCGGPSAFIGPEFRVTADDVLFYAVKVEIHAADMLQNIQGTLKVNATGEYHEIGDVWQMSGPHFHVFTSSNIKLQCGGASIVIEPGQITVSVGGSSIVLDPGTITQISPLINLNP